MAQTVLYIEWVHNPLPSYSIYIYNYLWLPLHWRTRVVTFEVEDSSQIAQRLLMYCKQLICKHLKEKGTISVKY